MSEQSRAEGGRSPRVVSPEWLERRREAVAIVDVREARDYTDLGHVPGAVNVPADRFRDPSSVAAGKLPGASAFGALLRDAGVERDDPLVAYDDAGGALAARFLLTAEVYGHEGRLALLDGGFAAWREAYPTTTAVPTLEPTDYEAAIAPDAPLLEREEVERAVDRVDAGAEDTVIVDTRTRAEYDASHVPTAVRLGWEEVLDEDGRLRPDAELEALLAERGITPEKRIVLYCNTARRLSHTYVTLRHLGYEDVAFYEGSLTDWVRREAPEWDPEALRERVAFYEGRGFEALVADLGEDLIGNLKLIGLYHQKQEGYFMLRTKVPGGRLTAEQARVIGEVADEFARAPGEHGGADQNPVFGDRYLDLTTRQDVQIHWITIEDVADIWRRYEAVGLTTLQACGNSVRNVVSCPAAGIDGTDTVDVHPVVERVTERFVGDPHYANLPRKFKVSVTGCHENCARAEIQDLALTPAVKDGRDGFAAHVGGGLSDGPRAASDLEVFVTPTQVDALVAALADLFKDHGSYLDTAVNRLRYLVEEWGVERFREELARYAPFPLEPPDEVLTSSYRGDHVGIHEAADGRYYAGLCVPTGRMRGEEFVSLARLAEAYGEGELRLTPNQNVLIPHLEAAALQAFRADPVVRTYRPDPGPFTRGIVTCTGSEFCTYGIVETKSRAIRWAHELDEWAESVGLEEELDVVRVHFSGCSASCAQPQLGDVGLRGEVYRTEESDGPALDVGLGGDLGRGEFIDWIAGKLPIESVPEAIQRTLLAYEADRDEGESFSEWTDRVPSGDLYALLARPSTAAVGGDDDAGDVGEPAEVR